MGDQDTPTRPYPILRHGLEVPGGDATPVDSVWFAEWRREITTALRDIRRDQSDALKGIEVRLGGIENRLNDGDSTIAKHAAQLLELIDQGAEHDRRLAVVEAHQLDAIVRRLNALEAERVERIAREQAAHEAAKTAKGSLLIRSRDALVVSAAGAVGLSIIAFLGWLITTYAKHG